MRMTLKMPRVGETVNEVVIVEWLVSLGDQVVPGQALVRVETDKTVLEVPSSISGQVVEFLAFPDEEVATGIAFVVIESG